MSIQADRLAMAGRQEESVHWLEKAVKSLSGTSKNADLWLNLANGLVRLNRPKEALRVLEQASRPDHAGDLAVLRIERAHLLLSLGHGRQARDLLANNIESLPLADRPEVWKALGEYCAEQGDFDRAKSAFAEWGRLVPDDLTPKIAMLQLALDNHDQALAEAMVEKLKATGEARETAGKIGRAMVLLQSPAVRNAAPGSTPPALLDAEAQVKSTLTEKNEGLPIAQYLMGRIMRLRNRPDEAITYFEAAWKGGERAALPPLIELLFLRNRFDDIAKLKGDATGSQLERLSAELALRSGLADQAERFIDQAIKADPEATDARVWQARMLTRVQKFDDAEASLLALARSQPRSIENWLSLLRFQAARKRTEAAALTEAEIRNRFKADRPELLEARCAWIVGDRPRADKAFAEAIRRHPEEAPGCMLAARFYEETGRPAEAEQCLRELLRRDPKAQGAALQLAALLSAHAKNLADWERAWAVLGPESAAEDREGRMFRAEVLSRCPDPARRHVAIDLLKGLVADLPVDSKAALAPRDMLIRLLLQEGRSGAEQASQIAGAAAGLEDNPELLVRHVQTLLLAGKWDAAEQQLDRLMAINPGDAREAKMRAYLAQNRVSPAEAVNALKNAVDLRGDRPGAEALGREAFARLEQLGPPAESAAEDVGRLLARRYPESSWLPARLLARRGHIDESLTLCRTAAGAGSRDDRLAAAQVALELVGPKSSAKGNSAALAGAVSVLETALQGNPEDAGLLSGLAVLRHAQGEYREEVRLYRKALDLDPGNAAATNNLALALSEGLEQPADGLELINALIAREHRIPALLDTRGVILTRMGRLDEAIADLEAVVRDKPSGIHHFHLARAYLKAGNIDLFQKVRELMRRDGLTAEDGDPTERAELTALLQK
jgi:tetratricopeptide (TPR) repeat protein